jgi:hypothetical protein
MRSAIIPLFFAFQALAEPHPVVGRALREPAGLQQVVALAAVVEGAEHGPLAEEALAAATAIAGEDGALRIRVAKEAVRFHPQQASLLLAGVADVPDTLRRDVATKLAQAGLPVDLTGAPVPLRLAVAEVHLRAGNPEALDRLVAEAPADQQAALLAEVLTLAAQAWVRDPKRVLAQLAPRLEGAPGPLALARLRLMVALKDPGSAAALAALPADQRPKDLVSRVAELSSPGPRPHRRWTTPDVAALEAEARAQPEMLPAWTALAMLRLERGEPKAARAAITEAARRLTHTDSDLGLVTLAAQAQDFATAQRIALSRADYGDRIGLLTELGLAAHALGRPDQVLAAARIIARLEDPDESPPTDTCEVPASITSRASALIELATSLNDDGYFAEAGTVLAGVEPTQARLEALVDWATHERRSPSDALAAALTLKNTLVACSDPLEWAPTREVALGTVAVAAADQRRFDVAARAVAAIDPSLGDLDARPFVLAQLVSPFAEAHRLDLLTPALKGITGKARDPWQAALAEHHIRQEQVDLALAALREVSQTPTRLRLLARLARHLDPADPRVVGFVKTL